jgi:hypothetical protein
MDDVAGALTHIDAVIAEPKSRLALDAQESSLLLLDEPKSKETELNRFPCVIKLLIKFLSP